MQPKITERLKARELREKGYSYRKIQNQLAVAKSTIHRWCQGIELTPTQKERLTKNRKIAAIEGRKTIQHKIALRRKKMGLTPEKIKNLYFSKDYTINEIANFFGVPHWVIYKMMVKENIFRRSSSESRHLILSRSGNGYVVKKDLTSEEDKLRLAGIMLYWAEGSRGNRTIDFTNSDPKMVQIFLKFLREICGVSNKRIRIYLYAYDNQNLEELIKYWRNVTGVPKSQFTKPYVRQGNPNLSNRKMLHGVVHVRYSDKELLQELHGWIGDEARKMGRCPSGLRDRSVKPAAMPSEVRILPCPQVSCSSRACSTIVEAKQALPLQQNVMCGRSSVVERQPSKLIM